MLLCLLTVFTSGHVVKRVPSPRVCIILRLFLFCIYIYIFCVVAFALTICMPHRKWRIVLCFVSAYYSSKFDLIFWLWYFFFSLSLFLQVRKIVIKSIAILNLVSILFWIYSRDRRGLVAAGPVGGRSGHSYGHVYGGAYGEDDYSISQHQARTANGAVNRGMTPSASVPATSGSVVAPAERQQQQQANGKTGNRYQDPAPRAWGDGGSGPRYVASPTHGPTANSSTVPTSGVSFISLRIRIEADWITLSGLGKTHRMKLITFCCNFVHVFRTGHCRSCVSTFCSYSGGLRKASALLLSRTCVSRVNQ